MTHGSLFSGIDGFSLAATWMGWENLFTCEIDEFCNIILEHYHKDAIRYNDIRTTDFTVWRGRVDVLTGGFPCQPYSVAGKRKGKEDERHLWPEMLRAIREISPDWIVGENVRGIINWDGGVVFDEVQSDMEALGYEVLPLLLPAAGVNAPHERYRTFFIAHADSPRLQTERARKQTTGVARSCVQGNSPNTSNTGIENMQPGEDRVHGFKITPDSNSNDAGRCGFGEAGCKTGENKEDKKERERIRNEFKRIGKKGIITDSCNKRLSWREVDRGFSEIGEKREEQSNGLLSSTWESFPTQPPIHSGNDGFSTDVLRRRIREDSMGLLSEKEIDKIISKAISKVREESIKASGNAVVSPLILQIFKTIQKYKI